MGKVLVVTGAGRGIGRATALLAAERGWKLCLNYGSNQASAEKVRDAILAKGGEAVVVRADVSKEADVVGLFEAADKLGPLGGLVNNAGVLPPHGRVENITLERLQGVFAVNVFGGFLCAREAVRRMSTKRGGHGGAIVSVSSISSLLGSPGRTIDYSATKGAIDSFVIGLSKEVAAEGIRVNAVRPGPVRTDVFETIGVPGYIDEVAKIIPMGRIAEPEEIARMIVWLLSDEASYVTGAHINMAGAR